jgi:hypothetical protein
VFDIYPLSDVRVSWRASMVLGSAHHVKKTLRPEATTTAPPLAVDNSVCYRKRCWGYSMGRFFRAIWKCIYLAFATYWTVAFAYGLWVFVLAGFRACGISSCPDLPIYDSRILNFLLALLPDQTPYALLIAIGRGGMWLPNLLISLHNGPGFLAWLMVRDLASMPDLYETLGSILP